MSRETRKSALRDSRGMASILITMVTMIVITLIVLGFATISRREQNNSLEQQLSTQAFYAAETGVNDARDLIVAHGSPVQAKDGCTDNNPSPSYSYLTEPQWLDSGKMVGYTCLLVDPAPSNLVHSGLVGDKSWIVPVTPAPNQTVGAINTIVISWVPSTPPGTQPKNDCPASTNTSFSSTSAWNCGFGLMRADLVPMSNSMTEANLASSALTGFFEPLAATGQTGNLPYSSGVGKASIVGAVCDQTAYTGSAGGSFPANGCMVTISGLASVSTNYTLRLNSFYKASDVTVTAYDSSGNNVKTADQVLIDSTGIASGVVRRIQVRVPLLDYTGNIPPYAIQSGSSICKRFSVTPGYFSIASGLPTTVPDTTQPKNPMCYQTTSNDPGPSPGG